MTRPPLGSATMGTYRCDDCERKGLHLQACSDCRATRYCGHACQKHGWKTHKRVCRFLKSMVAPSREQLHFVYSWHVHRVPAVVGPLPNGIYLSIANEHVFNALFIREYARGISATAIPTELQDLSRREQRRCVRDLMRKAKFTVVDDEYYMGVCLTDGVARVDPALLEGLLGSRGSGIENGHGMDTAWTRHGHIMEVVPEVVIR